MAVVDDKDVDDKELVSAIWERRMAAAASGDPLEMDIADLALAGLQVAGTESQRLLSVDKERELIELGVLVDLEEDDDEDEDEDD